MNLVAQRYQILERIGQGGMGTVYRATDTQTGQVVAVKQIRPDLVADDPEMIERFIREGEALRQLNHPNIVKMLAAGNDDGLHYLVLEYVSGGTLYDLLKRQPQMSVEQTVAIALELADALTRAHHLKIIHRDLKPANVLIAEDGTPRLTDFGIAKTRDAYSITQTGVTIGTPDYLSPEALQGDIIDVRSDIWAFGVMLFEMLAGKRPFEAPTLTGVMTAILTQPVPDLEALRPDVPVALIDLIYRMLEKDRNQRIPSVRQVGAELEAIQQGTPAAARPFDTPTPAPGVSHLPVPPTPFIGRDSEIAELLHLLNSNRLVTILAPGGMGKTRLALEVGTQVVFTDGVYFVDLAPLALPEQLVSTTADTVGFQFYAGGEPKQQLLDFLRNKHLLLIMDNFEHLLEGAPLVTDILQAAPNIKILTTSREKLNLRGETVYTIGGLELPETKTDALNHAAVRLFVQSMHRAKPGTEVTDGDIDSIVRICRLVQGMPLGIELAAAWIEVLSLEEIADEISKSLDFLETDMRDVPTRHRSIRAVFDYSWNLMHEDEQAVFAKLSVFRGGFTREAAQEVADANLRTLATLVNKSLIRRDPASGRYEVHELVRQYGESQLKSGDATRRIHASYFAALTMQLGQQLRGENLVDAVSQIHTEFENIRCAWSYGVEHVAINLLMQMQEALWLYCHIANLFNDAIAFYASAAATIDRLPQKSQEISVNHVLVQSKQAMALYLLGRFEEATTLAILCKKELDQFKLKDGYIEFFLVWAGRSRTDSFENGKQSIKYFLQHDPTNWYLSHLYMSVARIAIDIEELDEAESLINEGIPLLQQAGIWSRAWYYLYAAHISLAVVKLDEALSYLQTSKSYFLTMGDVMGIYYSNIHLATVYSRLNQPSLSITHAAEALYAAMKHDLRRLVAETLSRLCELLLENGDTVLAIEIYQASLRSPEVKELITGSSVAFPHKVKDAKYVDKKKNATSLLVLLSRLILDESETRLHLARNRTARANA